MSNFIKRIIVTQKFYDHTSLGSPNGTYHLKVYEILWCLYILRMPMLSTSINSDPMHREYMVTLGSQLQVKTTANFYKSLIFLKFERQYSVSTCRSHEYSIALCYDSPQVLSNVQPIHQCIHHRNLISIVKTIQPFCQKVLYRNLKWIAQMHESTMNKSFMCKEPIT